ncbi:hypothetical protein ACKKBG_A25860 [Auxenochlorella protothecoides x Auxenochlorella symbiontica]
MPELRLFRRRWHIASDTFPIVACVLACVHVGFLIPYISGAYSIESTGIQNNCSVGTAVRVAVYGMFAVMVVAACLEFAIVSIGLNGGPLEESKRAPIKPLLYIEFFLWIVLLSWTVYGTYIVRSPNVGAECWDNNPCAYSDDLPASCTGPKVAGVSTLSPPCKFVSENSQQWQLCFTEWVVYGVSYVWFAALDTADDWDCQVPPPGTEDVDQWVSDTYLDGNLTLLQEIEAEGDGDDSTQVVTDIDFTATGGSRAAVALYNEQVKGVGALTRNFEAAFLNATGVPFNPDAAGESAPWFPCQNSTCQKLIQAADECTEWDILLRLPDPSNRKAFFEGLVWTSWGILAFQVILVVVAFNSFPDYTEVDSWEGSLRHMSRFCCCGSIMQEAVLDTSEPASREIAKSLNMLFGGIDLDPTDRLFAALLVAEHQSDLRQRSVRHMLSRAGFITNMQKRGTFITGPQRRDGGQLEHFPEPRPKQSVSWHLPPSPFSTKAADIRPMYCRTTLKLDEGALEEGGHLDKAASGTDSPSLEWVREQLGTRLTLAYRYTPIVTPVCLPAVYCDHLTPQEAADIYSGPREGVPTHQLRQAQSMSLYAIAAYGLQNIAWGRGKRPPTCAANVNLFRKCMSKVFRLQNSYRQQNCEAILEVTGSDASDLLFVSYANTSGGALPYLVMRHRPSNSLVISIRGTVSMEDLITDLLSQPVDVSDWLPPWVQEAQSHKDECMYAHAGVVSAATAILLDMEEKGLLKELLAAAKMRALLSRLSTRYSGEGLPGSQTMDRNAELPPGKQRSQPQKQAWMTGGGKLEAFFTIDRVRTLLRQESGRTMKLAVTGHSLGAAVACMLSFQLHQECPDLHCWAFCPPGGLMSWNLSVISRRFCTSLVVGKDAISRLSFNTVKRMVDEMVVCLARCRRPKLVVLSDLILRRRGGNRIPPLTLCDMDEIPEDTLAILERYFRTSLSQGGSQPEMYPPGSVMFLRPFKRGRKKTPVQWDAVWINAADLIGEGLHISPAMMVHHRLFNLTEAFDSCMATAEVTLEEDAARTPATKQRIRNVLGKCCV